MPASRDFTSSILELAQKLCVGVSTFGPLIEQNWSTDPAVMAALTWARAACTIVPGLRDAIDPQSSSDPITTDPATWPGVDPSAGPYEPPEGP